MSHHLRWRSAEKSLLQRLFQSFWPSSCLREVLSLRKSPQARTSILLNRGRFWALFGAPPSFTKPLTKEKWKDLSASYPPIRVTESFMRAPTMEAGLKEEIRRSYGHRKTNEVSSFDDGLAEQQRHFLTVAKPITAALIDLDSPPPPIITKGKWDETPRWSGRCWRMLWFCWAMPTPV